MRDATKNSGRWARFRKAWTVWSLPVLLARAQAAEPVLLLDPGHGGSDTGARGAGGTESAFVLKTALALETLLVEAGIPVRLSRRTDEAAGPRQRFQGPEGTEVRLILSLHLSGTEGLKPGPRLFYPPPGSGFLRPPASGGLKPWGASPELSAKGKALAQRLASLAGLQGLRVFPLPGPLLEAPEVPALILEMGGLAETTAGGGELDPSALAASWSPFLAQLWPELLP